MTSVGGRKWPLQKRLYGYYAMLQSWQAQPNQSADNEIPLTDKDTRVAGDCSINISVTCPFSSSWQSMTMALLLNSQTILQKSLAVEARGDWAAM